MTPPSDDRDLRLVRATIYAALIVAAATLLAAFLAIRAADSHTVTQTCTDSICYSGASSATFPYGNLSLPGQTTAGPFAGALVQRELLSS